MNDKNGERFRAHIIPILSEFGDRVLYNPNISGIRKEQTN